MMELIAETLMKHDINLWRIGPEQLDENNRVVKVYCECGELLDSDANDEGWPSMANHLAAMIEQALYVRGYFSD